MWSFGGHIPLPTPPSLLSHAKIIIRWFGVCIWKGVVESLSSWYNKLLEIIRGVIARE